MYILINLKNVDHTIDLRAIKLGERIMMNEIFMGKFNLDVTKPTVFHI